MALLPRRLMVGVEVKWSSPAVRYHRTAVRLASDSLSALRRISHLTTRTYIPKFDRWLTVARDEPRLVLRRCRCRPTCSQNFLRTEARLLIGSWWRPFGSAVPASRVSAATNFDQMSRAWLCPSMLARRLAKCPLLRLPGPLVAVRRWRQPRLDGPKCPPAVKFHP